MFLKLHPLLLLAILAGCCSPPRTGSHYGQAVVDFAPPADRDGWQVTPHLPMRLAVAQVGCPAPSTELLDYLRGCDKLFSDISPLPCQFADGNSWPRELPFPSSADLQPLLQDAQQAATNLGADYLLLCGSDLVEFQDRANLFSPLYITIIGIFCVPGQNVYGAASAKGILIDLRTGRMILCLTNDYHHAQLATLVGSCSAASHIANTIPAETLEGLGREFVAQLKDPTPRPAPGWRLEPDDHGHPRPVPEEIPEGVPYRTPDKPSEGP
jgi:hypothetical protein